MFNQTVSFPDAYNDNDPGSYDPSIYSTSRVSHFPGPLMSNVQLPVDMTVASCHVVVATRDLIAIIHRESRISNRHTRMDLVLATGGAVAFEPGLHTPEA